MTSTIDRKLNLHRRHRRTKQEHQPTKTAGAAVPRILFVDDDPDVQTTFEMRMRPYRVQIDHAYFGTQGVVEAVKTKPDLILMDLAMPNGNGEYLLQTIRRNSETARIPVIVFSGMRDQALRRRVLRDGADDFVQKPASVDELVHAMSRFIDLQKLEPRS